MKTVIAGSRGITDFDTVCQAIIESGVQITEVVSGTARGVDRLGERWARETGTRIKRFPADWNTHGKAAGHIRNRQMAEYADAVICIWDGLSKGTWSMIKYAAAKNIPLYIHLNDESAEIGWKSLLTGLPPYWWSSKGMESLTIACWLYGCSQTTYGEVTAANVFESICEDGSFVGRTACGLT